MSCNIVDCGGYGKYTCSKCQLVKYCGKDCQRKDWFTHKRICFTRPEERIKGFVQLVKENYKDKSWSFKDTNISWSLYTKFMDDEYHTVSPLGGDNFHRICATCYKQVDYDGPLRHRIKYITENITYCLCNQCYENGAELCPVSYIDKRHKAIKMLVFYKEHFILLLNVDIYSVLVKIALKFLSL